MTREHANLLAAQLQISWPLTRNAAALAHPRHQRRARLFHCRLDYRRQLRQRQQRRRELRQLGGAEIIYYPVDGVARLGRERLLIDVRARSVSGLA